VNDHGARRLAGWLAIKDTLGLFRSPGDRGWEAAWDAFNDRRAELIDKEIDGTATERETQELRILQAAADRFLDVGFPLPKA
jgi:hypothetical protein